MVALDFKSHPIACHPRAHCFPECYGLDRLFFILAISYVIVHLFLGWWEVVGWGEVGGGVGPPWGWQKGGAGGRERAKRDGAEETDI